MSHYKPYPAYRASGVEWIGDVPEHWVIYRFKSTIATCRNGVWGEDAVGDENDIICVRVADFDRINLSVNLDDPTIRNVTMKERAHRLISRGDLLLEKSGGGEHQPVGCVVQYDYDQSAVCSNFVARMVIAPGFDSSFLRYLHAAAYYVRLSAGSINQTSGIQNLDQERYFNEKSGFPPLIEQRSIAQYIDIETKRIDTLIKKKTRFIELLKEKRQALITHAVTKGLDPNVKMKDSGVEWIGEVPEHWEIARIKHTSSLRTDRCTVAPDGSQYIGLEDVESGTGQYRPTSGSARQNEDSTVGVFKSGDVLYGKLRPYLKKAIVSDTNGVCSTEFLVLQPKTVLASWLHQWLLTTGVTQKIEAGCEGTKMPRADWEHVGSLHVPSPAASEQAEIIAVLDRETERIDTIIKKTKQTIDLLKERRSAFITAAVTGQIDLREAA